MNMNKQKHISIKRYQETFTILELLIVIAIITILAAVLLPALSNARKTANGIFCMNNIKQLGVGGYALYASDYGDFIPPYRDWSITTEEWTWVKCVALYIPYPASLKDKQAKKWRCPGYTRTYLTSYAQNATSSYYRLSSIVYPSTGFLLTESTNDANCYRIPPDTYMDEMGFRHFGKANILYWDFHAGTIKLGNIPTWDTRYSTTWNQFWRPWTR
ncbi:MAG: hypothetical protein A2017_00285 [Lentisphaerae bacterium GWF2_44_16]|nr:MAG: hypothetical protein A2017_00285 [Lentisphaerae bacterium GWF2_44_16]